MDTYKDRLLEAMKAARVSTQGLADHLETSVQAVRKVERGQSAAFSVPNHFKTCAYLRADPEWLATGEGDMVSGNVWPFVLVTQNQIQKLTPVHLEMLQKFSLFLLASQTPPIAPQSSATDTSDSDLRKYAVQKIESDWSSSGTSNRDEEKKSG